MTELFFTARALGAATEYNPIADHDYRNSQPSFREGTPGHFVLCNDEEFASYRKMVEGEE